MKARIPPEYTLTYKTKKAIAEVTDDLLNKERDDIVIRTMYIVFIAMYQAGLSVKTIDRVQKKFNCVREEYEKYRSEKVADEWAHMYLSDKGIKTKETKEKF